MPSHDAQTDIRRLAEASVWRVRLNEADLKSCLKFEAWLAAHPDNPVAWARVRAPWTAIDEFADSPEVMVARREALGRARRAGRRYWWRSYPKLCAGAVAAASAICALTAMLTVRDHVQQLHFRTSLGQRKTVTLSDRSRVALDAGTEIDVRYSSHVREIYLRKGQARFDDTDNRARPFVVRAGGESIEALGTDFNVDLIGSETLVTLIRGAVIVAPDFLGSHAGVMLRPGQQLVVSSGKPARVKSVNVADVTAWQRGLLSFNNRPLRFVVATINQYCVHPVKIDPRISGLRISGVFKEGDVATFADMITHYLPVRIVKAPDGTITVHPKK